MKRRDAPLTRPDEELSTAAAATLLGVSVRTVQLWVESGQLAAWKTPGGHRRIARREVERMLAARQAGQPAQRPYRVLVVEDDAAMRALYERAVPRWDPDVELLTAGNGFEALLRIGDWHPDLLITDLRLPAMDGFAMIRALRAAPGQHVLDIIVVTGMSDADIAAVGGLPDDIPVLRKPVPLVGLQQRYQRLRTARRAGE